MLRPSLVSHPAARAEWHRSGDKAAVEFVVNRPDNSFVDSLETLARNVNIVSRREEEPDADPDHGYVDGCHARRGGPCIRSRG